MPKWDTIALLDELKLKGLTDRLFRDELHHFGRKGYMASFRRFCEDTGSFHPQGWNQLLHDRLPWMVARCGEGYLKDGRTIEDLARAANTAIASSSYAGCKKQSTDKGPAGRMSGK